MGLDLRKVMFASVLVTAMGVILVVISLILQLLSIVLTDPSMIENVRLASIIYAFLLYPLFLMLYLWAGMRAAKRYGLDAVGSGVVAALSSAFVGIFQLVLISLVGVAVLAKGIPASGAFGTPEFVLATAVFGDVVGYKGVGLSAMCGVALILLSAMVNFVVGGFGGLLTLRKVRASEE